MDQALRLRLSGQGLLDAGPQVSDPAAAVTGKVCGLQAQDLFAATLGVRVRAPGSTLGQVERSRIAERTVVWTWTARGTLHLVLAVDLPWILAVFGPSLVAATARRRAELGLDEAAYRSGLKVIVKRLAAQGPATREELGQELVAAGLAAGYSIERHLLYRAALEGVVCMGPDRSVGAPGAVPAFVLLADWLGRDFEPRFRDVDTVQAAATLVRRYMAAFAPATLADMAAWSGLPVGSLRPGWESVLPELTEVSVLGHPAWVPTERLDEGNHASPTAPHVRLLPAFDTYLIGHRSRELYADPSIGPRINAGGGMIRAVVLVDGRVAGTWLANRKGMKLSIAIAPFSAFSPKIDDLISAEISDIERFLTG